MICPQVFFWPSSSTRSSGALWRSWHSLMRRTRPNRRGWGENPAAAARVWGRERAGGWEREDEKRERRSHPAPPSPWQGGGPSMNSDAGEVPVPGGEAAVTTRVRPGAGRTKWDVEWWFCPRQTSQTTGCHHVSLLLFLALTEHHVQPLADDRALLDAGPQISEKSKTTSGEDGLCKAKLRALGWTARTTWAGARCRSDG
jgi:hypothetical protein